MRKRSVAAVLAATAALASLATAPAFAASEFGDTCTGEEPAPGPYTFTTLAQPREAVPLTAPVDGVVTQVTVRFGTVPIDFPEQVKLLREVGPNTFTVTSETTLAAGSGASVADARMPVQAGERLAIHGLPFSYEGTAYDGYAFYCEGKAADSLGVVTEDVPLGSTAEFGEATHGRVPLAATIEPDVDHDGYGDETQDRCPQSAAVQIACPIVRLDTVSLVARNAVNVYVATSSEAPVQVTGTVRIGKGKSATLDGGDQTVSAGQLARFRLKLTKKVIAALKRLPRSRKLTLTVTARATSLAGEASVDDGTAKLRGRKR